LYDALFHAVLITVWCFPVTVCRCVRKCCDWLDSYITCCHMVLHIWCCNMVKRSYVTWAMCVLFVA